MIANHDICSSFNDLNKLTNTVKHHFREHLLIISPLQLPYIIFIPCPSNRKYMNLSDEKNHIHTELFMNLFDKSFIKNRSWHRIITGSGTGAYHFLDFFDPCVLHRPSHLVMFRPPCGQRLQHSDTNWKQYKQRNDTLNNPPPPKKNRFLKQIKGSYFSKLKEKYLE